MIVVDSREKKWEHIKTYFDKNHIRYRERVKLDAGDYFNPKYPYVVVDRKANLQEVCTNLSYGKENYHRFMRECKRAKERNIKMIVLVEGTECKNLNDIARTWNSKYSKHTGKWLAQQMFNVSVAYQVEWQFCTKRNTAKKILEILHYG